MVRSFVLSEKERETIREYMQNLPERMPGRVRRMRHWLFKTDLDEMESDIKLLRALKELEVPIGRTKGEGWSDQRGTFVVKSPEDDSQTT